jgi:hypothetical protein
MSRPIRIQVCSGPSYVKIAVNDEAYCRMMAKLKSGEPFVKTYIGTSPHGSPQLCTCSFRKNILVGDEIMREVEGKMEKVWSLSQVIASLS